MVELTYSNFVPILLALTSVIKERQDFLDSIEAEQDKKGIKSEYEFIVIGAGSAGATLATRLSEKYDVNHCIGD